MILRNAGPIDHGVNEHVSKWGDVHPARLVGRSAEFSSTESTCSDHREPPNSAIVAFDVSSRVYDAECELVISPYGPNSYGEKR